MLRFAKLEMWFCSFASFRGRDPFSGASQGSSAWGACLGLQAGADALGAASSRGALWRCISEVHFDVSDP